MRDSTPFTVDPHPDLNQFFQIKGETMKTQLPPSLTVLDQVSSGLRTRFSLIVLFVALLTGAYAQFPPVPPTAFTWISSNANSITVSTVTPGTSSPATEGYLVVINTTNSFQDRSGVNGRTIGLVGSNPAYSGSGEQIVYSGSGTSPNVTITGLDSNTPYFINVVGHYTGGSVATEYSTNFIRGVATCGHVPDAATGMSLTQGFEKLTLNSFTDATGSAGYLVKVNTTNSFTDPAAIESSLPTASAAYSGSGEQVVYVGDAMSPALDITGLTSTASTEYFFKVYSFSQNCTDGNFYFETTGFSTSERTCGPPPTGYNGGLSTSGGSVAVNQLAPVYFRSNYLVPSGLIVYINDQNSFTDPEPTYTTLPTENSAYVGSGQQAVEVGGPSSFFATTTGLTPNTTYYFKSYPYYTCGGTSYVNLTDTKEITLTTCNFSDNLASNSVFGNITDTNMELNAFTALSPTAPATAPDGYVIRMNTTNSFTSYANGTAVPTGNTVYGGSGEQVIYAGNSTTPNLNITGLSANTTYYFNIVAHYPACDGTIRYQQGGYTFSQSNQTGLIAPTITFNDISKTINDAAFNLAASSNSTGTITYQILNQTGTAATTLGGSNNATVTLGSAGTVTIEATQAPTGGFSGGSATATLTISAPNATITGDPFLLTNNSLDFNTQITTNSAGAITYSIIDATLGASINGSTITAGNTPGNIILKVSQAATPQYAATDFYTLVLIWDGTNFKFNRPFNVFNTTIQQGETLQVYEARSFQDDSPATFTIVTPDPTGSSFNNTTNVFTAGLAGTVTLRATSADGTYYNASQKDVTITVEGDPQTITFDPLGNVSLGDVPFNLSATASSGLAVSYTSSNTAVATVSGSTVTILGEGTTNITASQGGGGTFAPAADVVQSLTVNPIALVDQTVTASTTSGVCELTTAVSLASSQTNVNYYLRDNADNSVIQGPVVGTGASISFTAETLTASKTYEVFAELGSSSLLLTDKPTVTINTLSDQTVQLTQANATSADVSLSSSQSGVNYYLRNHANNAVVQGPLAGTGSSVAFNTENIIDNTTYNVLAASPGSSDLTRDVIQLDGVDDYISVPRIIDEEADITTVTAETWVYLPSSDNTDVNASIITHEEFVGGFGNVVPFYINITGGNVFAGHSDPDDGGTYNTPAVSYPKDQWFHVAASFNRSTIILYINGTQVSSVATTFVPNAFFNGLWRIGRNHEATVDASKVIGGKLADTRVWGYTRSAADIANNMNTVVTGTFTKPHLNYLYSETSGTTLTDSGLTPAETGSLVNAAGDNTNWIGSELFLTGPCSQQMGNTVTAVTKTAIVASNIVFNAPASLAFSNTEKTYTITPDDGLNPTLPAGDVYLTYEGRNGTTYVTSATAPTNVGDYIVIATVNASNPNYSGSVTNEFSITPVTANISLNLPVTNPVYSGVGQGISPFANDVDENPSLVLVTEYSPQGAGTFSTALPINAGAYDVRVNLAGSETNYTASEVTGTLTIDKAPLTARLNDAAIIYGLIGANNHPVTYTGFVNGETAAVLTINTGSPTAIFLDLANNGAYYPVSATPVVGGITWSNNPELNITSANYAITFEAGDITSVTPRPINVTADAKSIVYGDDANAGHTVTFEAYDEPGQRGLANGESVVDFTGTVTFDNITHVNVGSYTGAIIPNGGLTNSNYSINYVAGDLTITEKALTITAENRTLTYGDNANAGNTVAYAGFISGENESVLGGTLAFANITEVNAGTYPGVIIPSGLTASNYAISFVNSDLTINPKALTITANPGSAEYGIDANANNNFTVTYNGFISGEDETDLSGGLSFGNISEPNAGVYPGLIVPQGYTSTNYTIGYVNGTLTITQAPLTITTDVASKIYGEADPMLTYQISGTLYGMDAVTGALDRAAGEDIGVYPINQGSVTAGANYVITFVSNNLTIGQRALTLTAEAKSKTYGDTDPALTYQITSGALQGSDVLTGGLSRLAGESVGTYAIGQGTVDNSNYAITFVSDDLAVNARPITIIAESKQKVYGDADPALTYLVQSGNLVGSDMLSGSMTRNPGENVGSYAINQGTLDNPNYDITYLQDFLTINTRDISVTAETQSKIYGDSDPALTYQVTNGALLGSDVLNGMLSRVAGETVGTYAINQGTLANANYSITFVSNDLTITNRAITITADAVSKTYGDADPILTYQVTSGALQGSDLLTGSLVRVTGENAGTYAIQQGTLDNSNYTISYVSDNLTINPRALTLTADSKNKIYGDADPALTYQITAGALQFSDAITGALERNLGEAVGNYAINQGTLDAGANYTVTYVSDDLTIAARALTITANSAVKLYGDSDPAFTYSITSGALKFTDVLTGSLSRTGTEDAGNHPIVQGTLDAGSNYTITYVGNDLLIVQRNVVVNAEAKSKVYGDADPTLTYTAEALQFSDTFSGSLSRDAGENVGQYSINQGTLSLSSNYTLVFVGEDLTINARGLTVTADAQSKVYGDSDPSLTYQVTAGTLQGSDVLMGSLTRISGEDIGNYALQQGTLANSNYAITFVPNDLTIGSRAITVTADAQSKTYGDADPALTYQVTTGSLQFSDTFSGELVRDAGEGIGNYTIDQGTLALSANYDLTYVGSDLAIGKRAISLLVSDQTKVYGETDPEFTYSLFPGSILVSGDALTGTLSRDPGENVGSYSIGLGTVTAGPNYDLSMAVPATLDITPIALAITADDKTKVQGTADPALSYTVTSGSLINGDQFAGSLTRPIGESIGVFPIQQGTLTAGSNYSITFTEGNFTITDKLLQVITFDPLPAMTYGDANFTVSATGGASGNLISFSSDNPSVATVSATGEVMIVGAGTVNITANQPGNATYAAATPVIQSLTVNPAPLTITADDQNGTYGDASLPMLTVTYTGFVNGETEAVLDNAPDVSTTATVGSDAGSYPIFAAGATADNYQIIHLFGNLTIGKTALTITADDQFTTYGDAVSTLTLTYAGFVNGEDESVLTTQPNIGTTGTNTSNAGTYAITVSGATASNYAITHTNGTLTINKATVNVTADDQSRAYGANDPTFSLTYSGFKGTDNELALDTQPTGTTTAASTSAVGTYSIVPSGGVDNNYAFTYTNGTLTIDPAMLMVAVSNQTRTYGAANPSFELVYTGFANGEEATSLTTQPTASTTATASSGIGTYPITVSGGVSGNYAFTYVNATLTVNPATLTASAVGQSITYGEALPGLTFGYDGFVNDEDASVLITAPTASTTATSTSSAGTYPITVAGGVASNYLFSYVGADLTINQATLTVTAEDQSRSYGADNPALAFAYEGFVNGEDATVLTTVPTATTTATSTSSVGTYAITAAGGEDDNYAFSYTDGTLTVNPATLTVTAADQSKVYGSANPNLTVTYSGFQNGEDAAALTTVPTAATTASNTSSVGTYAITAAGGEATNYSLTYETGTLTVTTAELMVTADNQTRAFGEVNPAFTVTYAGFVNDEDASVVTTSPTLATTADESSAPGTYSIEVSGTEATNYSITEVAGTLTVTKANQEITFDFLDVKTTADEAFELTAVSSSGLTISYASSDETVATVNGATVTIVGPGTSTITASQSGDDHYNAAADVQQQLVVTQANDTRITSSIEIDAIADQTVGNDAITLTATVRPVDAPISWEIISGPATIDGNILTLGDQAGLVQVKGSIKETDEYKGSEDVVAFALLDANLVTPVIDFILPTEALNTETVTLTATVDAQGATTVSEADVVYTVVSGPGEISTTNELSFTDIGRVIVSASLPATAETNAISAQSSVEVIALYNLSGTIRDENNNPFTDGLVIVGDLNDITNSQTTSINADGTYTFTALRSGDYELFVTPFSIDYVMTFYGDVSPVTDPDAVPLGLNITSDLTNIDVTLQLAPQSNVDLLPDDQGGVISFFAQNNLGNGNRFILGRTENGEPLPNTLVILKTAADEYVAADVTNDLGLIEFMGLPTGDYKLLVDIPGVGTMSADVGVQEGQQVDVTALIDESGANFNVDEVLSTIPEELKEIRVFPNPVQDYFEIRSLKRVEQVQLYDINGRMLERFGATDQYDIRTLPEGLYMIKITTNEGTTIQRLMKQ